MTLTPTAATVADVAPEVTSPLMHGAHAACQTDAPFVRSHCGIALEGSGRVGVGASRPEPCPDCLDVAVCRVCGAPVTPLRVLLGL